MHFETTSQNRMSSGMVTRKNRGQYMVRTGAQDLPCSISSSLRKQLIYPMADPSSLHHRVQKVEEIDVVDPVAVGDTVAFLEAGDGTGVIHEVLPRRSKLSRKAPGFVPLEQVMVANVDQAVVVFAAAKPDPRWGLLDRYLVTTESSDLPALIVITKMDLLDADDLEDLEIYRQIGYPVLLTSTVDGRGLAEVKAALAGKISIFMGKSGVGKSSLLNAVQPGLGLKVSAVGKGEVGKGKHTTTHLEMFPWMGAGAWSTRLACAPLPCGMCATMKWLISSRKCAPTWANASSSRIVCMKTSRAARSVRPCRRTGLTRGGMTAI
jgi:ribosome biogenesis GTPase / thiamine phosphate phosphatase